ncbi:hypothetical protein ACRRTK_008610 [Alexandromys fortis]
MCMSVCVHVRVNAATCGGQKRASDPLDLGVQAELVVSHLVVAETQIQILCKNSICC